jgi:hypothetical protein
MHDLILFVDREGNRGIRRLTASATAVDDLLTRIRGFSTPPGDAPLYVLYTPDMLLKYSAMRTLSPLDAPAKSGRGSFGIRWIECERIVDDTLHCGGQRLDLRTGSVERQVALPRRAPEAMRLRRAVLVEGGRVVREREYTDAGQVTVEIVFDAGAIKAVYLLDEPAFESNLNQMFVLGRFDAARFEEAFNGFPYARAFRVLPRERIERSGRIATAGRATSGESTTPDAGATTPSREGPR